MNTTIQAFSVMSFSPAKLSTKSLSSSMTSREIILSEKSTSSSMRSLPFDKSAQSSGKQSCSRPSSALLSRSMSSLSSIDNRQSVLSSIDNRRASTPRREVGKKSPIIQSDACKGFDFRNYLWQLSQRLRCSSSFLLILFSSISLFHWIKPLPSIKLASCISHPTATRVCLRAAEVAYPRTT